MNKRDNWFTDYQEIPGVSDGMRKLAPRTAHFMVTDFPGKTVLDLGCNVGQMSFWAAQNGASSVTGVEYDSVAFRRACEARDHLGLKEVAFRLDDLDLPTAWHALPAHDVVMLLSVIDTKEIQNRMGILSKACMKTKQVFYLEGHLQQPGTKYVQMLLDHTDFTSIVGLGSREGRDLFRCTREILDDNGFVRTLREAARKYRRIGVIGNSAAGKSTLCEKVRGLPELKGWEVLDDCSHMPTLRKHDAPLLLFDYRAALYLDDLDVVFHALRPGEKSELPGNVSSVLRSPQMKPVTSLAEFHTVLTHGGMAIRPA